MTFSLTPSFLPANSADNPIGENINSPSIPAAIPPEDYSPSSEKTYVPYTGNLVEEFKHYSLSDDTSISYTDLGMYDIFYQTDGTVKENPLSLYEIAWTPSISQQRIAFYLSKDGVSQISKEHEIASNIIDENMVKWYYGSEYHTQYDCRWFTFQEKEQIPIHIGDFRLSGLFVIDEFFLRQEVLSATKIEKKYNFYRSFIVPIDEGAEQYLPQITDNEVGHIAWYSSTMSPHQFLQDTNSYFNRFEKETNGFQKLAVVQDPWIRLSSQIEHPSFYHDFEEKVDEICLYQQQGNEKIYDYQKYCSFLQSYQPQITKGKNI